MSQEWSGIAFAMFPSSMSMHAARDLAIALQPGRHPSWATGRGHGGKGLELGAAYGQVASHGGLKKSNRPAQRGGLNNWECPLSRCSLMPI